MLGLMLCLCGLAALGWAIWWLQGRIRPRDDETEVSIYGQSRCTADDLRDWAREARRRERADRRAEREG